MTQQRARRLTSGVLGAAGLIAALTLASRLVGFVRWLVQAWAVGATDTGTAYASANTVPNVLYEIVAGGALAGAVIPLLAVPLARHLREDVDRISSALLTWVLLALTPLALVVIAAAHPIAAALNGAAGEPAVALTATFLRVFALQIPLYGVGVVLTGVLQAHKRFLWPALAPLLSTAVVIVAYVAFGATTAWRSPSPEDLPGVAVTWLAWGTTAGVAALSLPLLVPVARSGVRLRPTLRFPDGAAGRARALALAGLATVVAQQVSVLVLLTVANTYGPAGTYPVYQYANAVYALPYAVFAVPLATSVFPRVAERLGTGRAEAAAHMLAGSTRLVLAAAVLGAALLAGLAPAATAVFELRGPMPGMTAAITALAPGVVGYALLFHLTRALYAMDARRAAVRAAALGWLVVAAASWLLAALPVGGPGPAGDGATRTLVAIGAGTSIGMTVAGIALLVETRRAAGPAALAGLPRTLAVTVVGAAAGAVVARLSVEALLDAAPGGPLGAAVLAAAAGGAIVAAGVGAPLYLADRATLRVGAWARDDEPADERGDTPGVSRVPEARRRPVGDDGTPGVDPTGPGDPRPDPHTEET